MAYSYLAMTRSTTLTAIEREAKRLALLTGQSNSLNFLAASADLAAERVNIVNQAERELMADFPQFFQSTTTVTTTASQRYTALPTTLWNTDLISVRWNDGSTMQNLPVREIARRDRDALPQYMLSDDFLEAYPGLFYVDDLAALGGPAIYWIGIPSGAVSAQIDYRARPTPFATGDIASPVTIAATPDDMIELLCLGVARRYCESRGVEWLKLADNLEARRIRLRDDWISRINKTLNTLATSTRSMASNIEPDGDEAFHAFLDEEY